MPQLPPFDVDTRCPPPGRYPMAWDEVHDSLVQAESFAASSTRHALWNELACHRAAVEAELGTVERLWLSGSFVSSKLDPSDVDLSYLVDQVTYGEVDGDGIARLARLFDKEWCVKRGMRIDAYLLKLPATVRFRDLGVTGAMATGDAEVFQMLGLYDEIWQRCRTSDRHRRGYVEVTL